MLRASWPCWARNSALWEATSSSKDRLQVFLTGIAATDSQAWKSICFWISQTLIFQLFNSFLCHSKTCLIFMRTAALVPKHFSFNGTHSFSLSLKAKLSSIHSWWVFWVEYLMKIVTKIEGVVSFHTRTLTISITAQIIYNITGEIQMACYEWEPFQWLHSLQEIISYLLVDD